MGDLIVMYLLSVSVTAASTGAAILSTGEGVLTGVCAVNKLLYRCRMNLATDTSVCCLDCNFKILLLQTHFTNPAALYKFYQSFDFR